jgi:hypothetical protein
VKRGFVRSVLLAFILVCGLQAIVAAPVLADADRARKATRPDPTRLWSEYPLNPREQPPSPTNSDASVTRPATVPGASNAPQSLPPLALVSVGFALAILAVGGVLLVSFGLRPSLALGGAWRLPRPRQRATGPRQPRRPSGLLVEGEPAVNNLVHRLLHGGGRRHDDERKVEAASASETARIRTRREIFTPYSVLGRERNETLDQPGNPTPRSDSNTDKVPADDGRSDVGTAKEKFAEVGEQVAAVLVSAEQAAEQIRESARREAERLRAETKDKAAATLSETKLDAERKRHESEKVRTDADEYSKETRGAADRYVAQTRAKIDKEAAQRRAEVDEVVRGIRRAAEQKAKDLETEALQRQKTLVQEVGRAEDRLQQLLGIFRGMTSQLEGLIKADSATRSGDAEGTGPVAEPLDEALKPRRSPSRST